jgi:hypothetical protein
MYDPAHARSRTAQPMGGNLKPDLTFKTCLVHNQNQNYVTQNMSIFALITQRAGHIYTEPYL